MYFYKGLLVTLLATLVSPKLTQDRQYYEGAATSSQIKFAEENNYDQTGPGAKEHEGAYKTYKTLEEALLGYLDDPDTKLPISERAKAYYEYVSKPVAQNVEKIEIIGPGEQDGAKAQIVQENNKYYTVQHSNPIEPLVELGAGSYEQFAKVNKFIIKEEPKKYRPFRPIALNIPQPVTRLNQPLAVETTVKGNEYEVNPQYTYSYGVHDRLTGDSKSFHETRNGDAVQGYYTVVDPDGQQRTVRYTADDEHGFKAVVQRTPTNSAPF